MSNSINYLRRSKFRLPDVIARGFPGYQSLRVGVSYRGGNGDNVLHGRIHVFLVPNGGSGSYQKLVETRRDASNHRELVVEAKNFARSLVK